MHSVDLESEGVELGLFQRGLKNGSQGKTACVALCEVQKQTDKWKSVWIHDFNSLGSQKHA